MNFPQGHQRHPKRRRAQSDKPHNAQNMAFGGLFGGSSSATPVTAAAVGGSQMKDQIKAQIGQELAVANATELVNKMTENCFELCQKAPYGTSDDACTDRCLEKYMRGWNAISKTYIARIQQSNK